MRESMWPPLTDIIGGRCYSVLPDGVMCSRKIWSVKKKRSFYRVVWRYSAVQLRACVNEISTVCKDFLAAIAVHYVVLAKLSPHLPRTVMVSKRTSEKMIHTHQPDKFLASVSCIVESPPSGLSLPLMIPLHLFSQFPEVWQQTVLHSTNNMLLLSSSFMHEIGH